MQYQIFLCFSISLFCVLVQMKGENINKSPALLIGGKME